MNRLYNLSKYSQTINISCRTYKSAISIPSLYSNSPNKLTTPLINKSTEEKFNGFIPIEDLDITYSCSSGPGGQNVNNVKTKVDVRFNVASATWLHPEIKSYLLEKYKEKLTKEGYLIFRSDVTRYQHLNLADCLQKIRNMIWQYNHTLVDKNRVEPADLTRKEVANMNRLENKRERSQVKSDRRNNVLEV